MWEANTKMKNVKYLGLCGKSILKCKIPRIMWEANIKT